MSVLGSSDGFNIAYSTAAASRTTGDAPLLSVDAVAAIIVFVAMLALNGYLRSHRGRLGPAIRDNELGQNRDD